MPGIPEEWKGTAGWLAGWMEFDSVGHCLEKSQPLKDEVAFYSSYISTYYDSCRTHAMKYVNTR